MTSDIEVLLTPRHLAYDPEGRVWGQHYCPSLLNPAAARTRGAGYQDSLWDVGQTLTVELWGGSWNDRYAFKQIFSSIPHGLRIVYLEPGSHQTEANQLPGVQRSKIPDIRVAFDENQGAWSYHGKHAHAVPVHLPTMNMGWFSGAVREGNYKEQQRLVNHEGLHAIGAVHGQNEPDCPVFINDAGYEWMRGNGMTDRQIFHTYDRKIPYASVYNTPWSADSLTNYWVKAEHTTAGIELPYNYGFGNSDYHWMFQFYTSPNAQTNRDAQRSK